MKTILVAVDLSAATVHVCAAAADLACSVGGRLVIFHAVPPVPQLLYGMDSFTANEVAAYGRSSRKLAAHRMEALQHWFRKRCPNTRTALHEGRAADNILRTAQKIRADFIVMGSHGHGAMYDILVGSTTHLVIRKAPCPIVLVPITAETGKLKPKKAPPPFKGRPWLYD